LFLTVIVVALTVCAYAITVNYPVYVACLVITLTQVYSLSGVDLHTTLLYRLAENGIGALTAAVISAIVLPISTYSVIRTGLDGYLQALKTFAADLTVHLTDPNAAIRIRSNARAVDHALFQLRGAVSHLLPPISVIGNGRASDRYRRAKTLTDILATATEDVHSLAYQGQPATTHPDATDLVVRESIKAVTQSISDAQRRHDGTPARGATPTADQPVETNIDTDPRVQNTVTLLRSLATQISLVTLDLQHATGGEYAAPAGTGRTPRSHAAPRRGHRRSTEPRDAIYTRSSALIDQAERRIEEYSSTVGPTQFAVRDLNLSAGTKAWTADVPRLSRTDYGTAPASAGSAGGMWIRGRVRGPDGAGIPAAVTLIDPRGLQAARGEAGPDGAYWLDAPAPGAYVLLTSAASHQPTVSTVIVPEQDNCGTVVNVRLAATGRRLTGTVTAAATSSGSTRPVPGARITLLDTAGRVVAAADTDQAGRYAIGGLPDGEYTVVASGYPSVASTLRVARGAGTIRHDIELNHARADVHPKYDARGGPEGPRDDRGIRRDG
jgi:hypothetical protein